MKINALMAIGMALVIVGAAGGAIGLSGIGGPYFSLSVYTNVDEGYQNTLRITLVNAADPAGQEVVVQFDGGVSTQTVTLDSLGKASISFQSGSPGYHFITCYWSDGTDSLQSTVGYFVVQGSQSPTLPEEPVAPIIPLSWIAMIAGAVMVAFGAIRAKP